MKTITLLFTCLLITYLRCGLAVGPLPLPTLASIYPPSAASPTLPTQQTSRATATTSSIPLPTTGTSAKTVNFVRMKSVQRDGESLGDCLNRLSLSKKAPSSSSTTYGTSNSYTSKSVQDLFDSFNTQTPGSIYERDQQTDQIVATSDGSTCRYQSMNYSHGTNTFLNIDDSSTIIYPGSVIQSKYIDDVQNGIQSQIPVPISTVMKSTNIKVLDHASGQIYTVPYNNADMTQSINKIIGSSLTSVSSLPVYFQMGTSDDFAYFSTKLGFNTNLQKKLGLYYPKNSSFSAYKKKIIFFFIKPIDTFQVSIDPTSSPMNSFFTSLLTVAEVVKRNNSWWGVGSPPIFIDTVTYGSALVLAVDYTNTTGPLYESVNGNTAMGPAQMQIILNKIIISTTLKVLSLGPFSAAELSAIKTGKWTDYLLTVPSTLNSQMTNPLLYTVKNFKQTKYNSSVNLEYIKINCGKPTSSAGTFKLATNDSANSKSYSYSSNISNSITPNVGTPISPVIPLYNTVGIDNPYIVNNPANVYTDYSTNNSVNSSVNGSVNNPVSSEFTSSTSNLFDQVAANSADFAKNYQQIYRTPQIPKSNILLQLSDILPYAPVNVYIFETNGVLIIKKSIKDNEATIELNSYFTGDEIMVDIRPTAGRKSNSSVLQGQVKITFIIDGSELPKGTATCRGNFCAERTVAVFTVNQKIPVVLP